MNDTVQRNDTLDGLKHISEVVSRFYEVERLYLDGAYDSGSEGLAATMVRLYRRILEYEARAACQFNRNGVAQFARNVITVDNWARMLENIMSAEADCEKAMRLLDSTHQRSRLQMLQSCLNERGRRVEELLEVSRKENEVYQKQILVEVQATRREAEYSRISKEEKDIFQLLRTSDYEKFKARNPDRVDGTCLWFIEHEVYQAWEATDEKRLLWVSADPGCGKSVLAKSLIENELKSTESRSICYFFFKEDNEDQRTIQAALCAVLHQLFTQRPFLIKHALPEYRREGTNLSKLESKLWNILKKATMDPGAGQIVCVFDALDECEDTSRSHLIDHLNEFSEESIDGTGQKSGLKILVTSRPYFDIERSFRPMKTMPYFIHLDGVSESEAITREIDLVIKAAVPEAGQRLDLDPREQLALQEELLKAPQRTYLWLKLILESVLNELSVTEKSLRRIVGAIPISLEKAYDSILDRSTDVKRARKLLSIVIGARRPLKLKEMRIALAIEEDCSCYDDLDLEKESTFAMTVRNLCGLFVNIVNDEIFLIHQTAKPFLLGQCRDISGSWKGSINLRETEILLANICMIFLNFADLEDEAVELNARSMRMEASMSSFGQAMQLRGNHIFLQFAACNWAVHLKSIQPTPAMIETALRVCDTETMFFRIWIQIYGYSHYSYDWSTLARIKFTPLMVASLLGLDTVVKGLIDQQQQVLSKDSNATSVKDMVNAESSPEGWPSLLLATKGGDIEVVRLHLDHGADIETRGHTAMTPLLLAASEQDLSMVRFLLSRGADVLAQGELSRPVLYWALCSDNDVSMAQILLEAGADIKQEDETGRNAVFWAINSTRDDVLQFVLSHGADIEHRETYRGHTPLLSAVVNKNLLGVRMLLKHGANANACESYGYSALMRASCELPRAIPILLENGADPELENDDGHTALTYALYYSEDIGALIAGGANLDHALLCACTYQDWFGVNDGRLTEDVLRHGANVHHRDAEGRTGLSLAAMKGHDAVVQVLLDHGADIDVEDHTSFTPLASAVSEGRDLVVKIFLEHGASLLIGNQDEAALHRLAAVRSETEMYRDPEAVANLLRSYTVGQSC